MVQVGLSRVKLRLTKHDISTAEVCCPSNAAVSATHTPHSKSDEGGAVSAACVSTRRCLLSNQRIRIVVKLAPHLGSIKLIGWHLLEGGTGI